MNLAQKLYSLQQVQGSNPYADRIVSEITYLYHISQARGGDFNAMLEAQCDALRDALTAKGAIDRADMTAAEAALASLSGAAKSYTAHCVAHAHIDMNWKWGYQETAAVTIETFRTMLGLMKEYPEFTFSQSQASVYRIVEEYAPEMLDEIRARVHEGRWEVTASTWVEGDKNMPSGESLVRQTLYTKRYLADLLDIDPRTLCLDFEPDTFGHSENLPEILQNAGVDYYYHCRGCDYRAVYNWQAPSGKTVLVYQEPKWYLGAIDAKLFADYPSFCASIGEDGLPFWLCVYGVGDHGGGPTRRDIERLREMAQWPLFPTIQFSTYAAFFRALAERRSQFPTCTGELNFVFNGCYTTQARIKMANRIGEARLYEAEQLSAAAQIFCGAKNAAKPFAAAWEKVLFSQFHDILPGSCVLESRAYCLGQFQESMAVANTQANAALHAIADAIDTSAIQFDPNIAGTVSEGAGVGYRIDAAHSYQLSPTERGRGSVRVFHLFNTTQYDRAESVELSFFDYTDDNGNIEIIEAESGLPVAWQFIDANRGYNGHRVWRVLMQAEVPAFGYNTYILRQKEEFDAKRITMAYRPDPRADHMGDTPLVLENELIRVTLDPLTCAVISYVDLASGREMIDPSHPAGVLRYARENNRYGMSAWRVGQLMNSVILNEVCDVKITDYRREALRDSATYEMRYLSSAFRVKVILDRGSAVLRFQLDVDWHEIGTQDTFVPQLSFVCPVAYTSTRFRYDVPFGALVREALPHDVPANSYIEMLGELDDDRHLMLLTDTKYGYRGWENAGAVTLLRSAFAPDPLPEAGGYVINLGIAPADTAESARKITACFNHVIQHTCGLNHTGTLGLSGRMLALEGDEIAISAIKPAEDGGVVIRLKNNSAAAQTVKLMLASAPSAACLTDVNEVEQTPLCVNGCTIDVPIAAYALATVRVRSAAEGEQR